MYAEQMLLENEGKKMFTKLYLFFFISTASEMTFFKFVLLYKLTLL